METFLLHFRAGDYILSINGVNVQNATNEFVWNLTKDNHMDLVGIKLFVMLTDDLVFFQSVGLISMIDLVLSSHSIFYF